jgi:predicted transcriptional regulator
MHEKGLVSRNESAKTHIYTPNFAREEAQEQYVSKMIKTLFSGSTSQLVLEALGNHQPSNADLIAIKDLIEKIENKK